MKRLAVLGAVAALVLVGCGDDDPTVEGGASSQTTHSDMAMGGTHLDHVGNPTSTCSPSGAALSIAASARKFDKDCLAAPASQSFTIAYDNKDPDVHNIVILESHTATEVLFRADGFAGPKAQTFNLGALKAGTYAFHCEFHPDRMSGTFIVK